jgi:hypothetical protein
LVPCHRLTYGWNVGLKRNTGGFEKATTVGLTEERAAQMNGESMIRQVVAKNNELSTTTGRRRRPRGGRAEVMASAAPRPPVSVVGSLVAGAG